VRKDVVEDFEGLGVEEEGVVESGKEGRL